jgi:hypothetical protein
MERRGAFGENAELGDGVGIDLAKQTLQRAAQGFQRHRDGPAAPDAQAGG